MNCVPKKIFVVVMVKNEQDVIESFVRHTLTFADKILIRDHMSSDKTGYILDKLMAEGLPVSVSTEKNPAHIQAKVLTELFWQALAEGADLVLPLDADEFLVGNSPSIKPAKILQNLSANKVYHLPWRLYAPQKWSEKNFLLYQSLWRSTDLAPGGKMIVGKNSVSTGDAVAEGNHNIIRRVSAETMVHLPKDDVTDIHIAHFYWRSQEQHATKVAVSWMNIVAEFSNVSFSSGSYRANHERLQRGEQIPINEIIPHKEPFSLKKYAAPGINLLYSANTRPNALHNLMAASVILAQRYREEKVFALRRTVATVLVYNGDDELFAASLDAAIVQDYPWREFFVCSLGGREMPEKFAAVCREHDVAWLCGANPFAGLTKRVAAKYIQFILPGEKVWSNKLREVVTCFESQELKLAMLSGQRDAEISEQKLLTVFYLSKAWQKMLPHGQVPTATLATLLINREYRRDFGSLNGCFMDGRPLLMTLWKDLLLSQNPAQNVIGFMPEAYVDPAPSDAADAVYRQMEWGLNLTADNILSDGELEQAKINFARRHRDILSVWDVSARESLLLYQESIRGGLIFNPLSVNIHSGTVTSIVIVSYNTLELLKACIASIRRYTEPGTYEIIVVDNASTDGSAAWLEDEPDIVVVLNKENLGFPKGCNQGMKMASGQEIMLLNSDTEVTSNWLRNMKLALYFKPYIGAVGCLTDCCSNFQQIEVPYKASDTEAMQEFAAHFNESPHPHKWVSWQILVGFCYLFKREVYDKIGGLDENFGMGNYEDDDYSFRIRQAGYDIKLCRDTFIHHVGNASFSKSDNAAEYRAKKEHFLQLNIRNKNYLLKKWQFDADTYKICHMGKLDVLAQTYSSPANAAFIFASGIDAYIIKSRYPVLRFTAFTTAAAEAKLAQPHLPELVFADTTEALKAKMTGKYDYILVMEQFSPSERENQKAWLDLLRQRLSSDGVLFYSVGDKFYQEKGGTD